MRETTVRCDCCGVTAEQKQKRDAEWLRAKLALQGKPCPRVTAPLYWWTLEPVGVSQTCGPLDFCSLRCVAHFTTDPTVRDKYPEDFLEVLVGVLPPDLMEGR
jgi:hypothetical protein